MSYVTRKEENNEITEKSLLYGKDRASQTDCTVVYLINC